MCQVAPYTGAWIEIRKEWVDPACWKVAPYTGAWIEINSCHINSTPLTSRSLHGSVD